MTRRPWYKRDGAAFISGTMGLTLEEKGAYSLCLDLIYSEGGPIHDDARWLAGICGVSLRKWTALRERLIDLGKLSSEGGYLMNRRATQEIAALDTEHETNVENGTRGARKRAEISAKSPRNGDETSTKPTHKQAENDTAPNKNNALGQAGLKHLREEREEEEESTSSLRSEDGAAQTPLSAQQEICGQTILDGRLPRKAKPSQRSGVALPDWVPADAWNGFVEMRKRLRKPLTDRAVSGILKKLDELRARGSPPGAVLDQSTERCWTGVFELKQDYGNGGNGTFASGRGGDYRSQDGELTSTTAARAVIAELRIGGESQFPF